MRSAPGRDARSRRSWACPSRRALHPLARSPGCGRHSAGRPCRRRTCRGRGRGCARTRGTRPPPRPERARSAPLPACAASRTTTPRRRSPPPPRATGRTPSFARNPPPRFVVLIVVESRPRLARLSLRLVHDAPALGDFRRIVGQPYFIVKQLAACVSQQLLQLRYPRQELPGPVECLNALGEGAQHREQALGPVGPVYFFGVIAHVPAFRDMSGPRVLPRTAFPF